MESPSNFSYVDYNIAASAFPYDMTNFEYLIQQHDISVIINLSQKEYKNPFPDKIELFHIPIFDFGVPDIPTAFEILQIINQKKNENKKILIHCIAGCGRTGLIIGLWKAQQDPEFSRNKLIKQLRSLRPCSIESVEQENFLKEFKF